MEQLSLVYLKLWRFLRLFCLLLRSRSGRQNLHVVILGKRQSADGFLRMSLLSILAREHRTLTFTSYNSNQIVCDLDLRIGFAF